MSSAVIQIQFPQRRQILSRNKEKPQQMWLFGAASLLFIALMVQLSVRISIIQKSYTIEGLRQENLERDREIRQLHLQYETLLTASTLRERARSELGMIQSTPQQIRHVSLGGE